MSETQSTQYNAVQGPYDELRKGSASIIERVNIRSIVLPFIEDANVLDLACGSGSYSHKFIEWGASRVPGIDISSAMLEKAKALSRDYRDSDRVEFKEADCSQPIEFEGVADRKRLNKVNCRLWSDRETLVLSLSSLLDTFSGSIAP